METVTVHTLAAALAAHQKECANETILTRKAVEALTMGQDAILHKIDRFNDRAWQGVGAVCLVIAAGVMSIIVATVTTHHDTTTEAATTASASKDGRVNDTNRILDAIAASHK